MHRVVYLANAPGHGQCIVFSGHVLHVLKTQYHGDSQRKDKTQPSKQTPIDTHAPDCVYIAAGAKQTHFARAQDGGSPG